MTSLSDRPVVRPAVDGDAVAIGRLYLEWWDEIDEEPHLHPGPARFDESRPGHPVEWARAVYNLVPDHDAMSARNGPYHLVAEVGGQVVAVLFGREQDVEGEPREVFQGGGTLVELSDLFVSRPHRGSGVGSALVQRLLRAGAERGITQFHLRSDRRHLDFYGRFGFRDYTVLQFLNTAVRRQQP